MKSRCEQDRRRALRSKPAALNARDAKRVAWERRVKQKYGLTPWDVAIAWNAQKGHCPICGVDLNTKVWVIDHDHKTGRFRGLLCAWDNHRVVSMCERAGKERIRAVLSYLWYIP